MDAESVIDTANASIEAKPYTAMYVGTYTAPTSGSLVPWDASKMSHFRLLELVWVIDIGPRVTFKDELPPFGNASSQIPDSA